MKKITSDNVRTVFLDVPHNPKGLGWKHNVHGCFRKKHLLTAEEKISCLVGVIVALIVGFIWFVYVMTKVQYP